jgi:hypothetical protein
MCSVSVHAAKRQTQFVSLQPCTYAAPRSTLHDAILGTTGATKDLRAFGLDCSSTPSSVCNFRFVSAGCTCSRGSTGIRPVQIRPPMRVLASIIRIDAPGRDFLNEAPADKPARVGGIGLVG